MNTTNNKKLISYKQLLQELNHLCKTNQSGIMLIASNDKHSIRFVLHNGQIIACAFTSTKGIDALPKIREIQSGSFSFISGDYSHIMNTNEPRLPDNNDIFLLLVNNEDPISAQSPITRPSVQAPQTPDNTIDSKQTIIKIEKGLSEHIGPMAEFICEDYIDDIGTPTNASSFIDMINEIALEIDDQEGRKLFKEKLLSALEPVPA